MCGISGGLTVESRRDLQPVVARIVESQTRRGPDASATAVYPFDDRTIVFGHNRLAIIDPEAQSDQPMRNDTHGLTIVFNGEIYNYLELRSELAGLGHVFRTGSDTEVLLAAFAEWREACFARLIGMFAFAILDHGSRMLWLARDRFGVKPLLYWHDGQSLLFASSAPVIARHAGLQPDLAYLARGLQYKYFEDDSAISPFVGLKALEPGHYARIDLRDGRIAVEPRRYYALDAQARALAPDLARARPAELEERLRALLDSACRLRLRADVPVGLSLSGGLDSTSIAGICAPIAPNLVGFSFGDPDDRASEGPLVALAARRLDMPVHFIELDDPARLDALFWNTMAAQSAPFPHTSMMAQYAVYERARAEGVKVLLGGQGGDEAFMGYRKFFLFQWQTLLRERRFAALPGFAMDLAPLLPPILKRAGVFWSERKRYSAGATGMAVRLRLPDSGAAGPRMADSQTILDRQILDVTRFSLPSLLRYEDRNSMGNSIESRLPFMDHRVMEFGLALPVAAKLGRGFGKYILRRAMKGKVPDEIRLSRDKRGFDTRHERWIMAGLGRTIRAGLHDRRAKITEFLPDPQGIDRLFSDEMLARHPQAFKEATSLIWLGDAL